MDGLAGHVVSSCHTNSRPCHQRTLEIISCPLKSLEALSAGFSLVPTFLHCVDIDPSDKQTDKCSPQMYETSYCDCRCTEGQSYNQSRILSVKSPTWPHATTIDPFSQQSQRQTVEVLVWSSAWSRTTATSLTTGNNEIFPLQLLHGDRKQNRSLTERHHRNETTLPQRNVLRRRRLTSSVK